eukprot:TRINITY_DN38465_c0_g1_i2.p2 TRINITY_DN38465_c0_g1~~TRINITY_DN38465_c0_g1_i2.p2  ORF type:complete len:318 (+),score=121.15 TRINITY_DN38465_c0_g1_i2:105-1058(+)
MAEEHHFAAGQQLLAAGTVSATAVLTAQQRACTVRTMAKNAVSLVLWARQAVDPADVHLAEYDGVRVPLLDANSAHVFKILELLEEGYIPAAEQGEIAGLQLRLYDAVCPDSDPDSWDQLELYNIYMVDAGRWDLRVTCELQNPAPPQRELHQTLLNPERAGGLREAHLYMQQMLGSLAVGQPSLPPFVGLGIGPIFSRGAGPAAGSAPGLSRHLKKHPEGWDSVDAVFTGEVRMQMPAVLNSDSTSSSDNEKLFLMPSRPPRAAVQPRSVRRSARRSLRRPRFAKGPRAGPAPSPAEEHHAYSPPVNGPPPRPSPF